jgi:hypothetical protein
MTLGTDVSSFIGIFSSLGFLIKSEIERKLMKVDALSLTVGIGLAGSNGNKSHQL